MKSSDASSSGNGSDTELLSSSKSKSKRNQRQQELIYEKQQTVVKRQISNYYEITQLKQNKSSSKSESVQQPQQQQQGRSLNQVPRELRTSKQSFHKAMETPCEFFVDVM